MRRDEISGVVSLHFFQHSVFFAEHGECAQLIERLLFANFAHSKSDVHKHPVAAAWDRLATVLYLYAEARRLLRPMRELIHPSIAR